MYEYFAGPPRKEPVEIEGINEEFNAFFPHLERGHLENPELQTRDLLLRIEKEYSEGNHPKKVVAKLFAQRAYLYLKLDYKYGVLKPEDVVPGSRYYKRIYSYL